MDVSLTAAALEALSLMLEPDRILIMSLGVVVGLVFGILPGVGGLAGLALLLPFTFSMDSYTAFAFLLGLAAVTSTGYPIPAILFGVPGGSASQATVLDGLPMTRRGEGGRALSAAFMASLMGGIFGALILALFLPILRPVVLYIGSPELLAFTIFGISMVATLSGSAPLIGMSVAAFGVIVAMVGADPQTATLRWTAGQIYLWDGVPLIPVVLGLFAIPELCELLVRNSALAGDRTRSIRRGMIDGALDVFRNWWLVLRCGSLGAAIGAIPGLGGSVVDWFAYAHAMQTERGAEKTFGKGDVRGVIAAEAANNAKEGGALIPTVALGVPGSPGMAIILGAFVMHGLVPGPDMVGKDIAVTYSMIWTLAFANILGAGLCYTFSGPFSLVAKLRYTLVLPSVLTIMFVGAFQASRAWGDLYVLLIFGLLGWAMKQLKWPRPPLVLGFVLGGIIERYTYVSITRYGAEWLLKPLVLLLLLAALFALLRPLIRAARSAGGVRGLIGRVGRPQFKLRDFATVLLIAVVSGLLFVSIDWPFRAKVVPLIVGGISIGFAILSLLGNVLFHKSLEVEKEASSSRGSGVAPIHMDLETTEKLGRLQLLRTIRFFLWIIGFLVSMKLVGLIPTVPIFIVAFMRVENREKWVFVLPQAIAVVIFVIVVFDMLLNVAWPSSVLGQWFPTTRVVPSV